MVFGIGGSNGAICGSIKFKMVAGGHLGMMALSRVTLAGLSCTFFFVCDTMMHKKDIRQVETLTQTQGAETGTGYFAPKKLGSTEFIIIIIIYFQNI